MYGVPTGANYPAAPTQQQQQQQALIPGSYAARSAKAHNENSVINNSVSNPQVGGVNAVDVNMNSANVNINQGMAANQNQVHQQHQLYSGNGNLVGQVPTPVPNQMPPSMPPQQPPMPPQQQQQQQYPYQQPQQQQFQNPTTNGPTPQQHPNMPPQQQQHQYQQPQQYNQYQQKSQQYGQMRAPGVDHQTTLLNQSIRRMQEATHIMRGAMEANDLSTTLDRATAMLGELGDPKHHHHHRHHHNSGGNSNGHHPVEPQAVMSPKHYYELHMMALDELPNIEEYFLSLSASAQLGVVQPPQTPAPMPMSVPTVSQCTMTELYEIVQYCPRSVPRLYLQICAGSALIRSGETTVKLVLNDLKEAVKCVQCPVRGLFLRHYLLQAIKDKLPDEGEKGDEPNIISVDAGPGPGPGASEDTMQNNMDFNDPQLQPQQMKQQDEVVHNPAVENLMGDLGVDVNGNDNNSIDLMKEDEQNGHKDALENLMGGLGVDLNKNAGGFFDEVPVVVPPVPPPLPPNPIRAPAPVSAAVAALEVLDDPNSPGTVQDSYQFVLSNFIEMNKLWVRIQHMPGDSKTRETKRKRERERNELRMMVGTNLVRLSELEGVTSAIYGTIILPRILDQIVACHDPLAQAYLMDCIIQVFPDEFHIQTLEVVLSVCPKLREKVNIRTILQSVMNRLANYYEDELLLNDEEDTEGVKMSVMMDSFSMFEECIKSVLAARGVKLTAREAIRLESSLLDFTLKCHPGQMDHIDQCLGMCAATLRGEGNHGILNDVSLNPTPIPLDDRAIDELEKLLSLPLEELALGLLELKHYSELLALLPWDNRKNVAITLLRVLDSSGEMISSLGEMDQLFAIITPLLRNNPITGVGVNVAPEDQSLVSKVFHTIHNEDIDTHFDMLNSVKKQVLECGGDTKNLVPLFYSSLKLLNRVRDVEFPSHVIEEEEITTEETEMFPVEELQTEVGKDIQSESSEGINGNEKQNVNAEKIDLEPTKDHTPSAGKEGQKDVKNEEDLSYGEDCEDDISYEQELGEGNIKGKVDELAADLDDLACVGQEQEEKIEESVPTEQHANLSVKYDLFADSPLLDDDVPIDNIEVNSQPTGISTKRVTCRKVFLFIQNIISGMTAADSFNLYLQAAASADSCASVALSRGATGVESLTPVAYTFFTEAFLAYEGGISDSKVQVASISSMIGMLLAYKSFCDSDYETLITKVTQYAARLLKKSDQCKMVMLCSHLFYYYEEGRYKNPQRVLECLQRSLKVADMCMASTPANLQLFIDILDVYLYHFEKQNPMISEKYISGLIALVNEHIYSIGANPSITNSKFNFTQIVKSIDEKKRDATKYTRYKNIVCTIPN